MKYRNEHLGGLGRLPGVEVGRAGVSEGALGELVLFDRQGLDGRRVEE